MTPLSPLFRFLIGTVCFLLCAKIAAPATFNVADGDVAGLINAINTSNANNEVDVINLAANGAYTLSAVNTTTNGATGLPILGDDIPGPDLTINGNGSTIQRNNSGGTPDFRILQVGTDAEITINNLVVASGRARPTFGPGPGLGGGIYNRGSLTLVGCTLNSNSAVGSNGRNGNQCFEQGTAGDFAAGGGVYSIGSSMAVISCTFLLNSATGGNGGNGYTFPSCCEYPVCNPGCCWGRGGDAGWALGGGIYAASLTISGCSFLSNSALVGAPGGPGNPNGNYGRSGESRGGAIFISFGGATIDKTTVRQNNAMYGGGIHSNASPLVLTNSTLSINMASESGGGLFHSGDVQTDTIRNCTFSDNVARSCSYVGSGAGLFHTDGPLVVVGCTFNNNSLTSPSTTGSLSLANTVLKRGNCYNFNHDGGRGFVSQGYNISNTSEGGDGATGPGGLLNGPGDIRNTDPMLDPAGLQDNGGPTQTIKLLSGSPAIDKGNGFGLVIDQRGFLRPVDNQAVANASGGDASDIGAFETDASQIAAGIAVTTTNDHDDGQCGYHDCSLREAVNAANSIAGDNTITFRPGVTGTIALGSALPSVITNVNIQGPGARILQVSGNNTYRVFSFTGGTSSMSGLAIINGRVVGSAGGSASGGGIFNQGTLTLFQCAIKNSSAAGAFNLTGAGGSGNGGGVFNSGVITMNSCTVSGNSATGGGGAPGGRDSSGARGGSANGGGVFNSAGTMTLSNCTFSGNTATGGDAGDGGERPGSGGSGYAGVYNTGTMTLTACTVSGNTGTGGAGGTGTTNGSPGPTAGGIRNAAGTTTVRNTISAANTGGDVLGSFTSQGYNLIGPPGAATGFPGPADQTGVTNPLLGALQNNGGPVDTMALQFSPVVSPAVDKGASFGLTNDERGYVRINNAPSIPAATGGDGTDIGAFELNPIGSGTDSDGDGMPDTFENFYGVSNPNADSDGDGLTDSREFQAGTNPRDPNSNLRVVAVAKNGNDFNVTFSLAVAGKKYRLTRKDALTITDSFWGTINGVADLVPSLSGSAQVTDPNGASVSKRNYRIEVVP